MLVSGNIAKVEMLVFESPKLGDVSYTAEDVIRFPQGIPGFEQLRQFLLVARDECSPFVFLTALERPDVVLPLMPLAPGTLTPVGRPSAAALATLGLGGDYTVACYAVASIGLDAAETIVNLRAPIFINLDTRLGCQVILPDETLPIAAAFPA